MSERRKGRTNAQLLAFGLKECPVCNYCWELRGFTRHYNACKLRSESRNSALQAETTRQSASNAAVTTSYATLEQQHSISVFTESIPQLLEAGDLHNNFPGAGTTGVLGIGDATDSKFQICSNFTRCTCFDYIKLN